MSELHGAGVICKNQECKTAIILKDYLTNPKHGGEVIEFLKIKPGPFKCAHCGQTFNYSQDDVLDFGESSSIPPSNDP